MGDLVAFHTREKLLLLAHDESRYRVLGRIVAEGATQERDQLTATYRALFLDALDEYPTKGGHLNALQHAAGWIRGRVPISARAEVMSAIDRFEETGYVAPAIRTLHRVASAHEVDLLIRSSYLDI